MKKLLLVLLTLFIAAGGAMAQNTITSSTMEFQGELTDNGDGTYTGIIMATAGFDNYAMIGSVVQSSASSIDGQRVGDNHDAYPNWDPDVPDYTWYALSLDGGTDAWDLRYLNTENDPNSGAAYTPLSGDVFWSDNYVGEDGQNWALEWSWGTEDVKYAFPGFELDITHNGSGNYTVKLIPGAAPAATGVEPIGPVVNDNTGESYGIIQAAIDAASSGDVIEVAAGMYEEELYIDKALDIRGPNYGNNPNDGSRNTEAIIKFPSSASYLELVYVEADNVSIDGFTIEGEDQIDDNTVGVYGGADNLTVENNILKNFARICVHLSSWNGTNFSNYRTGAYIANNYISNPDIYINFNNASFGFGIYLQGAYGQVSNNVVEETRSGIQIQPYNHPNTSSATGLVENNEFSGYARGMYFNGSTNADADWEFNNNTVTGIAKPEGLTNDFYGIDVYGFTGGDVSFTGNTINIGAANGTVNHLLIRQGATGGSMDLDATFTGNTWERCVVISDGTNITGTIFYSAIQKAVDAATTGDVIEVAAGTYNLTSPVVVTEEVTLTGNVTAPANVVVNAPASGGIDRDVFQIVGDNVTIEGFTIQGAKDQDPSGYSDDMGKTNSGIAIGGDYFILGEKPDGATDFTFGWWGIGVSGITISNNVITDNSYGIFVFHSQDVTIEDNVIHANSYEGNTAGTWSGKGIELYSQPSMTMASKVSSGSALPATSSVTIHNNQIYDNELFGIELNYSENYNLGGDPMPGPFDVAVQITDNDIYDNGSTDNYPWGTDSYDFYRGVSANGNESNVTLTGNTIYGHVPVSNFISNCAGIRIYNSENWTIQDNEIYGNLRGVYAYGTSTGITVNGENVIRDNAQGVVMASANSGLINNNEIYDNNVETWITEGINPFGVVNLDDTGTDGDIEANHNYWGDATGPFDGSDDTGTGGLYNPSGLGDEVTDFVDYDPWYASPDMTGEATTVQTDVINDDQQVYYTSVQEAILGASIGDLIIVTGTNNEKNIIVNKGLQIDAGSGGAVFNGLGSRDGTAFIVDNPAIDFNISGVTFENYDLVFDIDNFNTAQINNCVFNNNLVAIDNADPDNDIVDAEDNFWGDASGPLNDEDTDGLGLFNPLGAGDEVSEYVDYHPWYVDAGLTSYPIDIEIANPSCAHLEVLATPNSDVSGQVTILQFTVKWNATEGVTIDPGSVTSSYNVVLDYTEESNGYYYAYFNTGEAFPTINWTAAGAPFTLVEFDLDQTGPEFSTSDFEIAADTWVANNNGNYYFEIWGDNYAGLITGFADDVYLGSCDLQFRAKVFLQGPYNTALNEMETNLSGQVDFPATQPFTGAPWNYTGSEDASSTGLTDVVDWVYMQVRETATGTKVDEVAGLLYKDGTIKDVNGTNFIRFSNLMPNNDYYFIVYARNHMPVMTGSAYTIPIATAYDYTDNTNFPAYTAGEPAQVELETGVWGMVAGDVNLDGDLLYSGTENDRSSILTGVLTNGNGFINGTYNGYEQEDLTMDWEVKYSGLYNDQRLIILNLIELNHPAAPALNATYTSQVPGYPATLKDDPAPVNGPLDVFLAESPDELYVRLTTNENITDGFIDNVQFTLSWPQNFVGIDEMMNYFSSDFVIEPQGEIEVYDGMKYQTFAMVDWKPLPADFSIGDEVTLLTLSKTLNSNLAGTVSIVNNDFTNSNNADYYISLWGVDHTGQVKESALGIDDLSAGESVVKVYPNPAVDNTMLEILSTVDDNVTIKIMDVSSRVVFNESVDVRKDQLFLKHIGVEDFVPGTYFIEVKGNEILLQQKLIVR